MGDLFWLILAPVVGAYIGWRVCSYLADRDQYRAEEAREDAP
jgi:hypothetical protein